MNKITIPVIIIAVTIVLASSVAVTGTDNFNRIISDSSLERGSMPYAVDEWTMYRHDLNHTGYSSSVQAPSTASVKWSYKLNKSQTLNGVYGSVAVAGGKIYTSAGDGNLTCMDLNGAYLWHSPTIRYHGQSSSPAVADGMVFIGCDSLPRLYAFNAITGTKVWEYRGGGTMVGIYSSPAVTAGRIYFGTDMQRVLCVPETDPNGNGFIEPSECYWNKSMPDNVWSSPAVANGKVYIGCGDGNTLGSNVFYCLDSANGNTLWTYPSSGNIIDVLSSPALSGGNVFFGAIDKNVYCLNANTGSLVWNHPVGDSIWSSAALAYGRVFIGCNDKKMYCLDANTGAEIWNYTTNGKIWSSPTVADGKVYFGSCDRYIYCLNALSSGASLVWKLDIASGDPTPTQNGVPGSPTIYEGLVFIGGWDSISPKLYCFETVSPVPELTMFATSSISWGLLFFIIRSNRRK